MKSAALAFSVLSFGSVVLAQSATSTSSANTSTVTPSNQCNAFLARLNNDQSIGNCLNALITATSDFDPSKTANAGTSTSAAITTALNTICPSSFISCDESKIRGTLSEFYTQCQADLLGSNGDGTNGLQAVIDTYDVLYLLVPLKNAICSKDTDGKYCVNNMGTPTSGSATGTASGSSGSGSASSSASSAASSAAATHAKRYIQPYKRDLVTVVARGPEDANNNSTSGQLTLGGLGNQSTQMREDGLPYLFMTPNTTDAQLCTNCTAQVVGAYIAFENVTPYALGLSRSPILKGQIELWQRLKTCNGGQLVRDIINTHIGASSQLNSAFTGASVNSLLAGGAALLFGAVSLF